MAARTTDVLFRPFRCGTLDLPNRIVMAPMTRSFALGGIPNAANADYYRRRAEGGVGLILSEGTVIHRPASRNEPDVPSFYGDDALAGWKGVIDAVHSTGGRMGPQLWHTGAVKNPHLDWVPTTPVESPSGIFAAGQERGQSMTEEDVADTIAAFAKAAAAVKDLGFDTIELHGAHGYLIDLFFWAATNLRTDRYGGSGIRERSRFAAEIIAAVRAAVGPGFPIIFRVSQWKQQDLGARHAMTPDQLADWLEPLVEAGVDILHCSQRRFWEPEFPGVDGSDGLNLAGWAKKLTGAATISVGSVGLSGDAVAAFFEGESSYSTALDTLVDRMERDEFDLIAVGRALISDPHWVTKVRDGSFDQMVGFDIRALSELA